MHVMAFLDRYNPSIQGIFSRVVVLGGNGWKKICPSAIFFGIRETDTNYQPSSFHHLSAEMGTNRCLAER